MEDGNLAILVDAKTEYTKKIFDLFYAIIKISKKSLKIIKSSNISDHWKEKVIPHYAILI